MNNNSLKIYCDFDGTITTRDTVDKLLHAYADDEWKTIEQLWQDEEIGSRECLERQINCIDRITENELESFIDGLTIDPFFTGFLEKIKNNNIDICIVSDGFDLFINKILNKNKIYNIPVYSNSLIHRGNRLMASFPHTNKACSSQSGMCKCRVVESEQSNKIKIYIGDGKSDACAVKYADIIFAKNRLVDYCESKNINYIEFNNFKDIENIIFTKPINLLFKNIEDYLFPYQKKLNFC